MATAMDQYGIIYELSFLYDIMYNTRIVVMTETGFSQYIGYIIYL